MSMNDVITGALQAVEARDNEYATAWQDAQPAAAQANPATPANSAPAAPAAGTNAEPAAQPHNNPAAAYSNAWQDLQ